MCHSEIISRLSQLTGDPSEILFSITMQQVINEIAMRIGIQALTLSAEDLELAREEVKAVINHHLGIREYIDMGLDVWEIARKL